MKTVWKKALAVLLALVLTAGIAPAANRLAVIASAESVSGTCGADGSNLSWSLDTQTGVLTVSGTGVMEDYYSEAPWGSYSGSVRTLIVGNGVTHIGGNAFRGLENLTAATIGDDVETIGDSAFEGCAALTGVTLDDSLTTVGANAFKDAGLSSISLPRSVQEIGADAFLCGVRTGSGAFTPTLTQIDADPENAVFSAQDGVLYNKAEDELILYPAADPRVSFAVPGSVGRIADHAFFYAAHLESVTIPDSVTEIGEYAFAGSAALQSAALGNGLAVIGGYAFADTGLTDAAIPDGVTTVGKYAFSGCTDLTNVTFGKHTAIIGESAFLDCTSLVSVSFGSSVESIGKKAFSHTALTSAVIPDRVMEIEASTFANCADLISLHIPSTVIFISESAFADCGSISYLCADTADCYARTYADANGIGFRLCTGHDYNAETLSGSCGAEGDNVLWALNLGSGRMVVSGLGDMADYASSADTPWADHLSSVRTVDIRIGVTSIGGYAFAGCAQLSDVTIGEDVTRIGTGAFASSALTTAAVPASVTEIGQDAFACGVQTEDGFMPTLRYIDVEPDSAAFFSRNGVLFNKSRTALILYPAAATASTYEIPSTTKRIEAGAFKGNRNLSSVHVPSSVTQIGEDAFADCSALAYLCCDMTGSCAETYAADNAIPFRYCDGHKSKPGVAGDANGDGRVDLKDAILIRRYLADGWDNVRIYGKLADVDADGSITLKDVARITRYLAGGWNVVLQ